MGSSNSILDVLVIGGGFAGLSAALRLHRGGKRVGLLEKRPFLGGRAYSFREAKTGAVVDNGQHLLMGAYRETFEFLRELQTLSLLDFPECLETTFAKPGGEFYSLKTNGLPAPWHLAWGLLRYPGLGFRDKWAMGKLMRFCERERNNSRELDELSVAELLQQSGQTERAIRDFWEPLALATLNEPLEWASAQLFVEVLRQGLLSSREHARLVLPKVGFHELYTEPAQKYFEKFDLPLHLKTQASRMFFEQDLWNVETSEGKVFQAKNLLFAVPPPALKKLLVASSLLPELRESLDRFTAAPIFSINLWFEDFSPASRFVGLLDSPFHWLFAKEKIFRAGEGGYVTLVVSGAYQLAEKSKDELVALAQEELEKFYPELRGKTPLHSQVIKEFEATFSGKKGLQILRPEARTEVPGLFLAGDWIDTGLPATIESAVKSGHAAAASILERTA